MTEGRKMGADAKMRTDSKKIPVITVAHAGKRFGEHQILEDVNMHVNHHEIVCVLGISGSGKTTLFNLISGMLEPEEGSIATDSKIGYMMQKDLLMPWKTILENIALPLLLQGEDKKSAYVKVSKYLDQFGLSGKSDEYPGVLSGGMRQRAALLRTYMQSGEVLLLDEPFSSVDAITRHQLHRWLLGIFNDLSLSVLLITHDIEEALLLADRIYVLAGTPASIATEIRLSEPRTGRFEGLTSEHCNQARERIYAVLEGELKKEEEKGKMSVTA
jgi:ABC-type nitrate/sulfonate/bicarbonate transport system ATPase subunit